MYMLPEMRRGFVGAFRARRITEGVIVVENREGFVVDMAACREDIPVGG